MNGAAPIVVLLVDDHAVVTEGLSMLLARFDDIEVAGTASSGEQAVEFFGALRPDIVLMDLSMPGVDGVEATRRIRDIDSDAKVLALTAFLEQQLVSDAIAAGASGYLLKNVSGDELAAGIRTIASGGSILATEALPMLAGPPDRLGADLTPRERDVLEHLVHGLSNKHIAGELGLTSGTVRIHVSNILTKLGAENRTAAAYVARNRGLVPGPGRAR